MSVQLTTLQRREKGGGAGTRSGRSELPRVVREVKASGMHPTVDRGACGGTPARAGGSRCRNGGTWRRCHPGALRHQRHREHARNAPGTSPPGSRARASRTTPRVSGSTMPSAQVPHCHMLLIPFDSRRSCAGRLRPSPPVRHGAGRPHLPRRQRRSRSIRPQPRHPEPGGLRAARWCSTMTSG